MFLYVVPRQCLYKLILEKLWQKQEDVVISACKARITIKLLGIQVWSNSFLDRKQLMLECIMVSANVFAGYIWRLKKQQSI